MDYTKLKKDEFEKILYKDFEFIYREHSLPMSQTCMCWGIDCDSGWYNLIYELSEKINNIVKEQKLDTFAVNQVKSKYGTLRFYVSSSNDEIDDLITEYENKTFYTCEECGKEELPSTLKSSGWTYNMCNECWNIFTMAKRGEHI